MAPSLTLKIADSANTFDSWCNLIRLSSLRQTLAEGYHVHMCRNQDIRDIVDISDPQPVNLSNQKKKKVIIAEHALGAFLYSICLANGDLFIARTKEGQRRYSI